MTKYSSYWQEREPIKNKYKSHPIWVGIGFLLLIIIPTISYFASLYLLEENGKYGYFIIATNMLANGADPLLYVKIFLTVFISMALFAIIYLIYFIAYRIFGPSRYSSKDAPMANVKVKKYKR